MTYTGLNNEQYTTAKELGKGGEGTVYELRSHSGLVLKKYNEVLTADKVAKLKLMVSMRTPGIEAYAAWPADLVRDSSGFFCGFVMKKLSGYVPLHMVFSPMDRKKMFPDKGYNFLVHVARNLATAFFKLHEAGLVVGDVNEGNILISPAGMVAFIDCDSFQVRGNDAYYYCEVGVPRYTPPELLKRGSFERVVRTIGTDSFSLAVLIFQLLFLGRHPFAGKNKTATDIDEEAAIRLHYFAYSLDNKKNKLAPPADSFSITNLSDELALYFHQAFQSEARPLPDTWIKALDSFLSDMVTCGNSRVHSYPSKMQECPWCQFRKTKGIMFFLDDSYIYASSILGNIENFVNGFRLEHLEVKKWEGYQPATPIKPAPTGKKFKQYSNAKKVLLSTATCALLGIISSYLSGYGIAALVLIIAALGYFYLQLTRKLQGELKRLKQLFQSANSQLNFLINEYNNPADLIAYNKGLSNLQQLVQHFKQLPEEHERQKKAMEEELYNEQLAEYISQFLLESHTIQGIGPAKKSALLSYGIRTAADIIKLHLIKVPGIGPGNQQVLMGWRRQMASGFVYIPNSYEMGRKLEKADDIIARKKQQLEADIRREYQSANFLKLNITNRANILETQIKNQTLKAMQAKADVEAFRKLAA